MPVPRHIKGRCHGATCAYTHVQRAFAMVHHASIETSIVYLCDSARWTCAAVLCACDTGHCVPMPRCIVDPCRGALCLCHCVPVPGCIVYLYYGSVPQCNVDSRPGSLANVLTLWSEAVGSLPFTESQSLGSLLPAALWCPLMICGPLEALDLKLPSTMIRFAKVCFRGVPSPSHRHPHLYFVLHTCAQC